MNPNYLCIALMAIFNMTGVTRSVAQDTTTAKKALTLSGYAEAYYTYDFNKPANHTRPAFIYSHNRVDEVAINLAFLKATYTTEQVRANIALATGTYMNANYSAEPGVLKNVYEANVGVRLSQTHDLWLDAGMMPSHIGFESAIGKDNWTVTRSLTAENSPYFETGARLGYTSQNNKWYVATLYLNGWQRIKRADANSTPAFGLQFMYKPSSGITLNYSNFAGNDKPDSVRKMRNFQDLYGIFRLSGHWSITAGVDYGIEQKQKGSPQYNQWYGTVLIVRYLPSEKINIAARAEYYNDENGVIVSTDSPGGFKVFGFSANIDYPVGDNVLMRLEVRNFTGKRDIFTDKTGMPTNNEVSISFALAISF